MNVRQGISTFRGHRVPHVDFIGRRKIWFALSGGLIALSLIGLFAIGLKFSIDFTGGALLQFQNTSGASPQDYQAVLSRYGLKDSTVEIINGNKVQIRTKSLENLTNTTTPTPTASASPSPTASPSPSPSPTTQATAGPGGVSPSPSASVSPTPSATASPATISTQSPPPSQNLVNDQVRVGLAKVAGISPDTIDEQDVGPTWGSQISAKAIQGLVIFLILVALYIGVRFEVKMAGSALAALGHDLIITAGIYALVGREVTPAAVIAILTILGYSLYDTVVIFDKIKENTDQAALVARETYGGVVNISLNQTLMRSVNTSLVVLLPIGSLLLFGGSTLKDFAFALFVGVAVGTYSSIFVASPILVTFKEREPKYQQIRTRATQRAAAGKSAAPASPAATRPAAPARTSQSRSSQGKDSQPRPVQPVPAGASGNGEVTGATGNGQAAGDGLVSPQPAAAPAATSARPSSGSSGGAARKKPGAKPKPKRRRR
jgi:preprotein translocase subunit SecF